MLSMYPACFYKEEDGYSVIFPDLNCLATQGDSLQDAMEMAVECLAAYLRSCRADGETAPAPSSPADIDAAAVSKELSPDEPVGEAFVNIVSVDVEAYAKEHFDKSVRKTLTIPAWLNAAALEQGINFSQTLQEALLSKVQAR
ncbi:HicB family protein [Anaerotruncus sp. 1XD22-93]|nr:HicB family protein [Lachnospiraceae bacterium]NBI77228.1 HicB family protein [Lachnospiraceae bacterium]RKJ70384.1 HicB family protein [Anaerotruncus sp. 1XD22-93]